MDGLIDRHKEYTHAQRHIQTPHGHVDIDSEIDRQTTPGKR